MGNMILGYIKRVCQIEVGKRYCCCKTSSTIRPLGLDSDLPEKHRNHKNTQLKPETGEQI